MPPYLTSWNKETPVTVSRKQVFYAVNFRLPDDFKEQVAYSEIDFLECDLLMGFYSDPSPGDTFTYRGLDWLIKRRHYHPTRRGSRDKKIIAEIRVELLGTAETEGELPPLN